MKVSKDTIETIKRDYKMVGCYNLAKQLNLDPKTVYRYAKKFNLPETSLKFTAKYIERVCEICQNKFSRNVRSLSKVQKAYCSKNCFNSDPQNSRYLNSKTKVVMDLINKGLKHKEVSKITGFSMGSIASILNRVLYRSSAGTSFATIRKKFLKGKSCLVCGFTRALEACHIVPASKKGPNTEDNLIALCPNHHHLFDHNKLLEEEYEKIKEKVLAAKSLYAL